EREKLTIDQKLNVLNPPLSYVRQQNVDRFSIALAVQIPYPLLQLRYNIVSHKTEADQGTSADYLDLLNSSIPNKWFQISRETGFRIQGRLRREASSVASKYKRATGITELVSIGKMDDYLQTANLALEEIIITELKGRADLALWFLESHGLKLTCLKVRESDSRREHTFDFLKEKVTQEDQENLEQLLFLLDKF
ncbi:hypothetical protein pdam_00023469, partial [Pocillopora damicornis]